MAETRQMNLRTAKVSSALTFIHFTAVFSSCVLGLGGWLCSLYKCKWCFGRYNTEHVQDWCMQRVKKTQFEDKGVSRQACQLRTLSMTQRQCITLNWVPNEGWTCMCGLLTMIRYLCAVSNVLSCQNFVCSWYNSVVCVTPVRCHWSSVRTQKRDWFPIQWFISFHDTVKAYIWLQCSIFSKLTTVFGINWCLLDLRCSIGLDPFILNYMEYLYLP